jgi:REP element-mobilizing transposase RayT
MNTWGGKRKGAGRKRVAARPQVPHRTRPNHAARFPVLVTVRLRPEWRGLRHDKVAAHVRDIVERTNARGLVRICEYTAIDDHMHLLVEAADRSLLSRGMKGFSVRMAHRLHRLRGRLGSVVADRYHARELRTPLEVKRGLTYVLNNARKHGYRFRPGQIDRCSSGPWSDVFRQGIGPERHGRRLRAPTLPPRTWLLALGWRRHGLVDVDEVPGAPRAG